MERKEKVGNTLFWLVVPVALSFGVGLLVHQFVSALNTVAVAMLAYVLFTLWVIGRRSEWHIRGPLTLVNLALFAATGYVQWDYLRPQKWPAWTPWIGAVLLGGLWVAVFVALMYRRGKRLHQAQSQANEEQETVLVKMENGHIDADVRERILAALKLASSKGDLTVDAAEIMRQMGLHSVAKDRESRAAVANAIMEAIRMGILEDEDRPVVRRVIRALLEIPEREEPKAAEEEEAVEAPRIVSIDWGR